MPWTLTNGLINIKFSMASTDKYANGIHIGLKERAREWKIFIIPLTETELQNNSDLDINIELVKRRWQHNIQIVAVIRPPSCLKKEKISGSIVSDWKTLKDSDRKRKQMVDISPDETDRPEIRTSMDQTSQS